MSDKSTQDRCSYQVWWILPAIERRAGLSCGDWAESASYAYAGYWHDPSRKRSWIMPVTSTATSAIFIVLCQPIRSWFLPRAARLNSVVVALAFVRCRLVKACYHAVQATHRNRHGNFHSKRVKHCSKQHYEGVYLLLVLRFTLSRRPRVAAYVSRLPQYHVPQSIACCCGARSR